jgi:hypothetical protein
MMKHLTNGIVRTALIAAVATATLVNSLAQEEPRYGLYIGDRDTYRVITYLQPTYDPRAGRGEDIALMLRWSCAYSQFAKGYQSNPLEQVYIYGIAVDPDSGRIWASDHNRNRIVAFEHDGSYIRAFNLPQGVFSPRKMAISNRFGRTYLYVSASGKLWVFGPLEELDYASWEPFVDEDDQQVSSVSGVRVIGAGVLISNSGGKAAVYKWLDYRSGARSGEWDVAGEDIDYIADDTILLAVPGNPGTIKRLKLFDRDITDFITGLPGRWQGIAVGPEEIDGTRFIYIATYQTFPNALFAYRYNPNSPKDPPQWFGAASPLPYKSGYVVAIGPVWDCSQCNASCPEDVNRDGVVNDIDLLSILFAFGTRCGN